MDAERSTSKLHTLRDDNGVVGFVAIDSTVLGRARGGLRLLPDVTGEELARAARTMTLKYGFLGLAQGGAKAGIRADPEGPVETRQERLRVFGRAAFALLRDKRYVPDADMGTRASDIRWMMQSARLPVARREWRHGQSGWHTASSCLAAARAALARQDRTIAGCRVAVEGFGQVGASLVSLLHEAGARVVGVSTSRGALYAEAGLDVPRLLRLASDAGSAIVDRYPEAERLPKEDLLTLPVDLLCPCARHSSIHEGNVARITAAVVCAGANDAVSPDAERTLWQRGVAIPPDFISNCGGVLGGTLDFAGVSPATTRAIIERTIQPAIRALLDDAEREGVAPRALAERAALARHARARAAAETPGLVGRVVSFGLDLYRRGWVPAPLMGAVAPGYLERGMRA